MKKLFISSLIILSLAACSSKAETTDSTVEATPTTLETLPPKSPENCSEVALGSLVVTEEYLKICLDAGDLILYLPCPDGQKLYLTGFDDKTIAMRTGIQPKIMPDGYTEVELMSICDWESV
jgi:hypothetical protein